MSVKTSTLAHIYEIQGYKQEALVIYEEILRKNPDDKEARLALVRLKNQQHRISKVNQDKLELFINAKTDEDYHQLEEWLIQWN